VRYTLLALAAAVLLWTAASAAPMAPSDAVTMSASTAACHLTDAPAPDDSDGQWRGLHYPVAAIAESVWKSAPIHAELAAGRGALVFDLAHTVSSPDPPVRSAPHYLRHTPLLI
jgi:hypothetical protein